VKTKLIALVLLGGASAFAQTRFSIRIGSGPDYGYAADLQRLSLRLRLRRPQAIPTLRGVRRRRLLGCGSGQSARRQEWRGVRNHQNRIEMYGD